MCHSLSIIRSITGKGEFDGIPKVVDHSFESVRTGVLHDYIRIGKVYHTRKQEVGRICRDVGL